VITLEEVSKSFDSRVVLQPTSLTVEAGHCLALVGPSGCGKSTLLRLLVGLLSPDRGRIVVGETLLTRASIVAIRRRTGYVIQAGGLFPHMTASENVTLLARHLGWSSDRTAMRLQRLVSLVGIDTGLLKRYPAQLSGGEQQRIGIMRALMLDPPVLLLDEPMGALDQLARARLREDLKRIFLELRKTVIVVTHDLGEAAALGDQIALMRAGCIVQRGTLAELVETPADDFVREFIAADASCR
jgi:osmoprotectant transport system ATP-binding protein